MKIPLETVLAISSFFFSKKNVLKLKDRSGNFLKFLKEHSSAVFLGFPTTIY